MHIENFRWLATVVAQHKDQKIAGRTRLQKTIWLLQRLGLQSSYSYKTYHYGPYSEGVQAEVELLESFGVLKENSKVSQADKSYYVIEVMHTDHLVADQLPENVKSAIPMLEKEDAGILELAATYDAFRSEGAPHMEAMDAVRRKKGEKCNNGKLKKAVEFVGKLGLQNS
ncbi:MAG: hypothetical protein V3V10_10495 [Planctomycetota bacterium]